MGRCSPREGLEVFPQATSTPRGSRLSTPLPPQNIDVGRDQAILTLSPQPLAVRRDATAMAAWRIASMERARPSRLPLRTGGSARNRRVRKEPKGKATKAPAKKRAPAKRRETDKAAAVVKKRARLGDGKEVLAVALLAASLFFGIALVSYDASSGSNLSGKAGAYVAGTLFYVFGLGAFILPITLFLAFLGLVRPEGKRLGLVSSLAFLAVLIGASMLVDLIAPSLRWFGERPGGALGGVAADGMESIFSLVGSAILVSAGIAAALVIATGFQVSKASLFAGRVTKASWRWFAAFVRAQLEQHRAEREALRLEEEAARAEEEAAAAAAFDAAFGEAEGAQPVGGGRKVKRGEDRLEADLDGRVAVQEEQPQPQPQRPKVVLPPTSLPQAQPPTEQAAERSQQGELPALPPDPAWAGGGAPAARLTQAPAANAPTASEQEGPPPAPALPPTAASAAQPEVEATHASDEGAKGQQAQQLSPAATEALIKAGVLPPGPVIEVPKAPPAPRRSDSPFDLITSEDGFSLPPLALLNGPSDEDKQTIDEAMLHDTASRLKQKLADFGINGQVERIRPGPVVTMYEFAPAPGVKISKIAGLSDDLAMALEAMRVRIVAPIPGRGVVGIEVPNRKRETVFLREILEQDAFLDSKSRLTMAVGKDIEGMPFVADLARMPHLLMSGTTGSGKSVSVNSMIMSLLFKATPEEVRFIMVDPKMLELSIYEGIPHLLLPVVTDPRKAALALRWAVDEMERRYSLLAEYGVRDLAGYNRVIKRKLKERAKREEEALREAEAKGGQEAQPPEAPSQQPKPKLRIIDVAKGETEEEALARAAASEAEDVSEASISAAAAAGGASNDEAALDPVEAFLEKKQEEELELKKLPYLVIIIDELADLMMVASKEVETYIARIAQKARAAGIHLMVATQRPSVDVVTGLIKANFPSRISFALRSRVDSQTILDTPGAEKLLGMGDGLILPPTSAHLQRIHAPYVSEDEINRVVDFLKEQGTPVYDESILKAPEEDSDGGGAGDDLSDELYDQAIAIVSEMKTVSISMLQRRMRIGYNRSARMIERMERDGIVGPADGARPREVLISGIGEMPEA